MRNTKRILLMGVDTNYGRGTVMGVDRYCREHTQWEYHLCRSNSPDMFKQIKIALHEWKPDGVIAHIQSQRIARLVASSGLPTVNVAGTRIRRFPTVVSDNIAVGKLAAAHFLERGFKTYAFAAITPEVFVQQRHVGFTSTLAAAGHTCHSLFFHYKGNQDAYWVQNRKDLALWLQKLPKPVALMASYDPMAQLVTLLCHHLGFRIPEDVAIVGVGNDEFFCQLSTPPLSSVEPNSREIGYRAARILDQLMRGGKAPTQTVRVPPLRLVTRRSTDIISVEDPEVAAAIQYIRNRAGEPTSVKDLLREIPLSRKTLERRFIKFLGRRPAEEISRVHLERATVLLEQTVLSIPAVARQAGFSNRIIFSRAFRRHMGLSPHQYRQKYLLHNSPIRPSPLLIGPP